jgi:hypothetical protein
MLEHCLGLNLGAAEVGSVLLPSYIPHTNIKIPMAWSQLTGFRLIQIWSGGSDVVQCKEYIFFPESFRSWLGLSSH